MAGDDFGPELAGRMLETHSFDLAEPWRKLEPVLDKLTGLARTPAQRARAWRVRARYLYITGHEADYERAARAGYECALLCDDLGLQAKLLNEVAGALAIREEHDMDEAIRTSERVLELTVAAGGGTCLETAYNDLAFALALRGRSGKAVASERKALETAFIQEEPIGQITFLANLGRYLLRMGGAREALGHFLKAREIMETMSGQSYHLCHTLALTGLALRDLADYAGALGYLSQALEVATQNHLPAGPIHGRRPRR